MGPARCRMGEPIRVLYVDDNARSLETRSAFLGEFDRLEVVTGPSAAAGLARLAESHVDCVVSDHDMPGMDGVEFLETVRVDHPSLPFIVFSGCGHRDVVEDALGAGATDFVRKSAVSGTYALLANRIENAVDHHRVRRRLARLERDLGDCGSGDTGEPRVRRDTTR